jgi:hypothetical protein
MKMKLKTKLIIALLLSFQLFFGACSKKPAELYNEGMKSFTSGKYLEAQETFEKGIRKYDSDSLYSGFIAANLVTGKYPHVNESYNNFTDKIHDTLIKMFGEKIIRYYGITTSIVPYQVKGGNRIPPDFPATIAIQALADPEGFVTIKKEINKIVKK